MTHFAKPQYGARHQWLLGIGFVLVGLGAWWQLQRLPEDDGVRAQRERRPDYVVQGFSALETDATGRLSRRLHAERLRHYADEDLSELDEPRLILYRADGPPWLAESRLGTVHAAGDNVRLSGDVRLDREADASNRAVHLRTERLDIWRQTGLAETDLPVRIDSDSDSVTANGMRLWYLEDHSRTSFHGRARIRLSPESAPPSAQ